ncbi:TetR/AcrR family transcriptional regulator [Actinosynnema sp. NPDC023658]|uniref:TetR/AcrR family transcriptional regulator n=1 Tax=Actinosynnema sp. NPDC023658 TaxID=3155465 RepID=UPI0033E061DB
MADKEAVRRPGGRSARVRAAVHQAVVDLVTERGYGNFTMGDIAAQAGVADSSLYRRWGTLENLTTDVAITWLTTHSPIPDTGSLAGDLRGYAAGVARDINGPTGLAALRLVIALAGAGEAGAGARDQFITERRRQLQEMLDRAQARGEPAVEALDILDHILAPLYIRTLFGMGPVTADQAHKLADGLLARTEDAGRR